MIFSGDLTYMQAGIDTSGKPQAVSEFPSLKDLFFSIVPSNIVDPFKGGNILQVMFLAIFFGVVLNKMGLPRKLARPSALLSVLTPSQPCSMVSAMKVPISLPPSHWPSRIICWIKKCIIRVETRPG